MTALLTGRRVLITGGANGIGAVVARRFADFGATGAVLDLPAAIDAAADEGTWPAIAADVTDEQGLRRAITECAERLGGIDGVVACAGVVPSWQRFADLDLQDLDRVLAVNVRGVAATIKHTAPLLSAGATIVAVASLNSWKGDPHIASYVASKHAVLGLVRSAALGLGPDGIRVNCVGPGPIATDALKARMASRAQATGLDVDVALESAAAGTALGRIATAQDVADVIAFLSADLSNGMTGQLLNVDGGILVSSVFSTSALAGRAVLVTGASGGIGSVTVGALGAAGATVVAQYHSRREEVDASLAEVPNDRKHVLAGELGTPDAARALWRDANALAAVDVLVLNAAVIPDAPMDGPDQEWDASWTDTMQVNVIGAGALLREAVRDFAARGGGTAIVLSSWAAQQGSRIIDLTAYAASKAAIRNLAQTLARHYVRDGVNVHVLAPGVVSAGMAVSDGDADRISSVAEGLAAGRLVTPEEVAAVITFLATDACPSLSGATLDINGASYVR